MARKRGNNEGSISRRKDGRWEVRYTVHPAEGPKRKVLYGKTQADVSAKLTKAMADRDSGLVFDDKNSRLESTWIDGSLIPCVARSGSPCFRGIGTSCPTTSSPLLVG